MFKTLSFLLALLIVGIANAQQDEFFFTTGRQSPFFDNPASYGLENQIGANVVYRYQWVGVERAPKTIAFVSDYSLENKSLGLGISYLHETIGFMSIHRAKIPINYTFKFASSSLSIGVAPGIYYLSYDPDWIAINPDPSLPTDVSGGSFDIDAGIVFKKDNFIFGFTSTHLTAPSVTGENFKLRRHYSIVSSYKASLEKFSLQPVIMLKHDGSTTAFQGVLNTSFMDELFGVAVGYRVGDIVIGGFLEYRNFNLAYNYGINTNPLNQNSKGSHEIRLGYRIKKVEKP